MTATVAATVETVPVVARRARRDLPAPEARWLTAGPAPLFAWLHRAGGDRPAGSAVLCPPLYGEHACSYPLQRGLAASLAAAGVTTVRVDYEGTGDSGGTASGPGRVDAWLADVGQAAELARSAAPGPLVLLGVRSGALVAAAAAELRGDLDALVLWDPWPSGRPFLRRYEALQVMEARAARGPGVELPGFLVGPETAAELGALRLPPALRARRALVVVRPERPDGPFALCSPEGGASHAEVLLAEPGEQEALFEASPELRRMPEATARRVVAWVARTVRELGPCATGDPAHPDGATVPATRPAAIEVDGRGTVYERVARIGPHGLFAVETCAGPEPGGTPVVVLLTSGTNPHVGPNRQWVTLARRWALRGVRCLRVDLSGWGDSDPRPGRRPSVGWHEEAFDDVRDILESTGASRTVLVGLCSGAYQAFEGALAHGALGVLAVNPRTRFTPDELVERGEVSPRRRICDPRSLRTVRTRRLLPPAAVAGAARLRRALRRMAPPGGSWLEVLAADGVLVYALCDEASRGELPAVSPAAARRVRVDVVDGLDHALFPAADREVVEERLSAALARMAAPARAARGAPAARPAARADHAPRRPVPVASAQGVPPVRRAGHAVARRLFPAHAARSRPLRRALLRRTLAQLERAFGAAGMAGRLWLMGGVAIGYARTGEPLRNDLCDVDLGYADGDHASMMAALDVLAGHGFVPTHRLVSNAGVQTAMRLRRDGVWVDLVRCFRRGDREYWVTYLTDRHSAAAPREVEVETEVAYQEKVPTDPPVHGTTWLRAADLDAYLSEQYGAAWRAPDRVFYANRWDHVRDSPAVVRVEDWRGAWEPWTEERRAVPDEEAPCRR